MERVPEPEVMDDPGQALAYARADFAAVNAAFVDGVRMLVAGEAPRLGADLGCGPGDIPARLAAAFPDLRLAAIDASAPMLRLARERLRGPAGARVRLVRALVPDVALREGGFDLIVSNSLVHHLGDPLPFWQTVLRLARPGAAVHIMDLSRPESAVAAQTIVDREAREEDPILRRDFYASLLAAFTPGEVRTTLPAPLAALGCRPVGDRHWIVSGRLPQRRPS